MKCDGFETRLNEIFDARGAAGDDPHLAEHARACPACRETLRLYEALLDGLDARVSPDPSEDFAAATLNRLAERPRRPRKALAVAAALSVAAALLISVGPRLFQPPKDVVPPAQPKKVVDSRDPARAAEQLAKSRESRERYLSMIRRTGRAMATLPNQVRRVAMPADNNPVAPLTDSFEAAFDALRRTLPSKTASAGGESQS